MTDGSPIEFRSPDPVASADDDLEARLAALLEEPWESSELSTPVVEEVAAAPAPAPVVELVPAVSIRTSVKPDYIVCLEDGKKLKMLKRHLMTAYGLTPDGYRTKWGLPADYPMVAPNYAEARRQLAKDIGLGRKPGTKVRAKK